MKKILVSCMLMAFATASFADCTRAYFKASAARNKRNLILVGTATVASGGGAVILATGGVAGLLAAGYTVGLATSAGFTQGGVFSNNQFKKILNDFRALKDNKGEKHLSKIIADGLEEAEMDSNEETVARARNILLEGFNSMTFCPIVKIKRNGEEKRAVFNRLALVKHLAENI
jgi:hypothetical protein